MVIWDSLNEKVKGIIVMSFGFILLLHTLNILQRWLSLILIIVSLGMIAYGFWQARLWQKIDKLVKKS